MKLLLHSNRGGRARPPQTLRTARFRACALAALSAVLLAAPAAGQQRRRPVASGFFNRRFRRPDARPFRPRVQQDPAAVSLLRRMFHPAAAYSGVQRTQAEGRRSEQLIEGDPRGRVRLEFQSPASLAGDIIIRAPGYFIDYNARARRAAVAYWPVGREQQQQQRLVNLIRAGSLRVERTGTDVIAGRSCEILALEALRAGAPPVIQRKLWIDRATGIVMRNESWNANGQVSASYMVSLSVGPAAGVQLRNFTPASLPPGAIREALFPAGRPHFATLDEARAACAFPILAPADPPQGYSLDGIWVFNAAVRMGKQVSVLLRYTSGVNHFSLYERIAPRINEALQHPRATRAALQRWQVVALAGQAVNVLYIGHLSPAEVRELQSTLR